MTNKPEDEQSEGRTKFWNVHGQMTKVVYITPPKECLPFPKRQILDFFKLEDFADDSC